MDERRKHGWPFWFAVVVIALPVLYVASSGPARMIASRSYFVSAPSTAAPGSPIGLDFVEVVDGWWLTAYAPLMWAADREWGEPLAMYWDLFEMF